MAADFGLQWDNTKRWQCCDLVRFTSIQDCAVRKTREGHFCHILQRFGPERMSVIVSQLRRKQRATDACDGYAGGPGLAISDNTLIRNINKPVGTLSLCFYLLVCMCGFLLLLLLLFVWFVFVYLFVVVHVGFLCLFFFFVCLFCFVLCCLALCSFVLVVDWSLCWLVGLLLAWLLLVCSVQCRFFSSLNVGKLRPETREKRDWDCIGMKSHERRFLIS